MSDEPESLQNENNKDDEEDDEDDETKNRVEQQVNIYIRTRQFNV